MQSGPGTEVYKAAFIFLSLFARHIVDLYGWLNTLRQDSECSTPRGRSVRGAITCKVYFGVALRISLFLPVTLGFGCVDVELINGYLIGKSYYSRVYWCRETIVLCIK